MKLGKLLQQNESDITPDTYELPKDINQLKEKIEKNGGIYIAKPSEGSQGDGIKLISGVKDIPDKSEYVV
jgi:glutathione synthase/RimK-type ligase-like ATP-grasp enzyme